MTFKAFMRSTHLYVLAAAVFLYVDAPQAAAILVTPGTVAQYVYLPKAAVVGSGGSGGSSAEGAMLAKAREVMTICMNTSGPLVLPADFTSGTIQYILIGGGGGGGSSARHQNSPEDLLPGFNGTAGGTSIISYTGAPAISAPGGNPGWGAAKSSVPSARGGDGYNGGMAGYYPVNGDGSFGLPPAAYRSIGGAGYGDTSNMLAIGMAGHFYTGRAQFGRQPSNSTNPQFQRTMSNGTSSGLYGGYSQPMASSELAMGTFVSPSSPATTVSTIPTYIPCVPGGGTGGSGGMPVVSNFTVSGTIIGHGGGAGGSGSLVYGEIKYTGGVVNVTIGDGGQAGLSAPAPNNALNGQPGQPGLAAFRIVPK